MNRILEILKELRPDVNFPESRDFIEDYLLDSFDIMSLTSELEKEYGIKISTKEILPENFQNIDAIAHLIEKCGGILS